MNRGDITSSPMPGPLGRPYLPMPDPYLPMPDPYLPMPDPYLPMPGPFLPMPGPFGDPLDFQYDDQLPLTPEQDLRSFDSEYGQGLPYYDYQLPLTPEQDLRSFDSFQ